MKIAEIYKSIQGEGQLTGVPSVFVRTSGCNLRCWFCDTPYTSWKPEGTDLSTDEIIAQIEEWDCRHVVITGGEPMIYSELIPLCERLRQRKKHITIETSGTLYLPLSCNLISISPKLSGSTPDVEKHPHWSRRHERTRINKKVLRRLMAEHVYQLKFVVDDQCEIDEIDSLVNELPLQDKKRVLLMPQGVTIEELDRRSEWLLPLCEERGYSFCPRKQIEWFGSVRGT